MAWVVVAGAAITTVGGAILNKKSSSAASSANQAASDAATTQAQIGREQWDSYKEIYQPLELAMVKEASNYDSPENFAKAAGDAQATVSSQFSNARAQLERTPGLDPSSGAYQAGMTNLGLAEAATGATQQNAARQKVKDVAYARKTDALSLGKGLPAQASSTLASAAQTNTSVANSQLQQGTGQAAALGNVVNRVLNSNTVSNWLGNNTSSNVNSQAVAAANGTTDPIGSLATLEGW